MMNSTDLVIVNCSDHHDRLARGLWNYFSSSHKVDYAVGFVRAHKLVLDMFLSAEKLANAVKFGREGVLDSLLEVLYLGKVSVPRCKLETLLEMARTSDFKMLADVLEPLTIICQPGTESMYLHIGSDLHFDTDTDREPEFNDCKRQCNKDGFMHCSDVNPNGYSSEPRFFSQVFFKCPSRNITKSKDLIKVNCINHHNNLVKSLWNYFLSSHGVDYDVGSVRVHRLILDVFLSTKKLAYAVKVGGWKVLNFLLEVVYTGKVAVPGQKLEELLVVAKASDFKMLVDVLETLIAISQPGTASIYLDIESNFNSHGQLDQGIELELINYEIQYNKNAIDHEFEHVTPEQYSSKPEHLSKIITLTLAEESHSSQGSLSQLNYAEEAGNISQIGTTALAKESQSSLEMLSLLNYAEEPGSISQIGTPTLGEKSQSNQDSQSQSTKQLRNISQIGTMALTEDYQGNLESVSQLKCAEDPGSISQIGTSTLGEESQSNQDSQSQSTTKLENINQIGALALGEKSLSNLENLSQLNYAEEPGDISEISTSTFCEESQSSQESQSQLNCAKNVLDGAGDGFVPNQWNLRVNKIKLEPDIEQPSTPLKVKQKEKSCVQRMTKTTCECEICGLVFSRKDNLMAHILTHTGGRPHKCDICQLTFRRNDALEVHKLSHSNTKPFKCEFCGKSFSQKKALKRHIITHTGEWRYKCDICEKTFFGNGDLKRHRRVHTGEFPFACTLCNAKSPNKSTLVEHVKRHTVTRLFSCDICLAMFSQRNDVRRHIIFTHEPPATTFSERFDEVRYKCFICPMVFEKPEELVNHSKIHSEETLPFWCLVCEASFPTREALRRHKGSHTNSSKRFQCTLCDKTYAKGSRLKDHLRSHSHERPFKCHLCPHSFKQSSILAVHIKYHCINKPFKCDLCPKGFKRKHWLVKHKRLHFRE